MQLVEQHVIGKHDPRYSVIDAAAFKSKNLYNAALYELRQSYIREGKYLNCTEMDKRMQASDAYKALPAKVAQKVLDQIDQVRIIPRLVNGRTLKARNQWYNKRMKELKLCLLEGKGGSGLCSSPRPAGCFNRTHQTTRAVSIDVHTCWNYNTLKRILFS